MNKEQDKVSAVREKCNYGLSNNRIFFLQDE